MNKNCTFLTALLFWGTTCFSQGFDSLNVNNLVAGIYDNGGMFNDPTPKPFCHHKEWKADMMFAGNIWISASDLEGNTYISASEYSNYLTDFEQGPIRNNQDYYHHSMVKVTQEEIDYHKANYNQPGYQVLESILAWRGNGNPENGEAIDMAPFQDANQNGCYDPVNGDYPIIRGDQAIYSIYSDGLMVNAASGSGNSLIEVHSMLYGFNEDNNDDLNNTLFLRHTIINRSNVEYTIKVGQFIEFDLGRPDDDFLGCDPSEDLFYVYNGDDFDEPTGGAFPGFGYRPPAFGVKFLGSKLHSFGYYNVGSGPHGSPQTAQDFNQILYGRRKDGSPIVDLNGDTTLFFFPGDPVENTGWTEATAQYLKGDRRGIGTFPEQTIAPGERIHYDMLLTVGRNLDPLQDPAAVYSIPELKGRAARMEEYYEQLQFETGSLASNSSCPLGVSNSKTQPPLVIAPNPTTGIISIQGESTILDIQIYSTDGKLVYHKSINDTHTQIQIPNHIGEGLYLLNAHIDSGRIMQTRLLIDK